MASPETGSEKHRDRARRVDFASCRHTAPSKAGILPCAECLHGRLHKKLREVMIAYRACAV